MNKKYLTVKIPYWLVNLLAFLIEQTAKITGRQTILNREKMLEVREPYWRVSPARAQRDFNYRTRFAAERGIEKTIRWYKDKSWL